MLELTEGTLLKGKPCKPIADGADVILTRTDRVVPDFIVVCNKSIIRHTAIHGAPDLIVEILSTKTAKRDKGYKKDLYERCGVREYWIVLPLQRSIEVYALIDGKYELIDVYALTPDRELAEMTDEEKAALVYEFSPYIFPGLIISLNDVFEDIDY
jgi:Uma2 family endonuclease